MTAPQGVRATPSGGHESSGSEASQAFGDRLARLVDQRRSQLVLGLDPDPARLWPEAVELAGGAGEMPAPPGTVPQMPAASGAAPPAPTSAGDAPGMSPDPVAARAARAVLEHCRLAIESAGQECVAVKLQVACFERLGGAGWAALARAVDHARDAGLLVIADAKRGDVSVTAAAYAQAFFGVTPTPFGPVAGLGADALTVNPLLGEDSLQPLLDAARRAGAGLVVLVRTSNPGAEDLQETTLAGGGSLSERLAGLVDRLGAGGVGACGLSDVGAVVGATAPERLARMRELMPHTVFLLPGVGAQGGRVEDLAPAFAPGRAGGLISASRSIVFAHERDGGDPAAAARQEAARLRELAWSISR
ncbi:MAG TPA: orotidine-5'-phosphate decarboxylase [Solirubrobacteraceae bacterium]|nr:orotidine-5'-phosphate decarboxylase [Solirubrobacteraceae bacterium]